MNAQFSGDLARNSGIWLGAGLALGCSSASRLPRRSRSRCGGCDALAPPRQRRSRADRADPPRQPLPAPPADLRACTGAGGGAISLAGSRAAPCAARSPSTCMPGGTGWTVGSVTVECPATAATGSRSARPRSTRTTRSHVLTPGRRPPARRRAPLGRGAPSRCVRRSPASTASLPSRSRSGRRSGAGGAAASRARRSGTHGARGRRVPAPLGDHGRHRPARGRARRSRSRSTTRRRQSTSTRLGTGRC